MKEPKTVDWRNGQTDTESDADDVELSQTPPDVVKTLGFDPKEFSEESQ